MVSYSPSIVTVPLSCIIFEVKRVLVDNRDFSYTPAFDAPVRDVSVGMLSYRLVRKDQNSVATRWCKKFEDYGYV